MLTVRLPSLPPSINHAYWHVPGGGKRRTSVAKAWQDGAVLVIRAAAAEQEWTCAPKVPLDVAVLLGVPRIWTLDLDNRLKLILDALAAGLDLDDRYIVHLTISKEKGPEAVDITVRKADPL